MEAAVARKTSRSMSPEASPHWREAAVWQSAPHAYWQALLYFNIYRSVVVLLFLMLLVSGWSSAEESSPVPALFPYGVGAYLASSLLAYLPLFYRWPAYPIQVSMCVVLDVVCLSLLMFSSGGVGSGFDLLLLVSVFGNGLLAGRPFYYLYAALAVIAVLFEETYRYFSRPWMEADFMHAGLFCLAFFAIAWGCARLSRRISASASLAERRRRELERVSKLTDQIVRLMETGIVVLDRGMRVRLINQAACRLLNVPENSQGSPLSEFGAPGLIHLMTEDSHGVTRQPIRHELRVHGRDLQVSVVLMRDTEGGYLLLLEEAEILHRRARVAKEASLARLTAGISHEIRNPLGAIGHAVQLLGESGSLGGEERRLVRIVDRQARRMNVIVESVMQLGRGHPPRFERIAVGRWLDGFARELRELKRLTREDVLVRTEACPPLAADTTQLHQVLWNLSENGLRYSTAQPLLEFSCGLERDTDTPYVEVADHGPGIEERYVERLFEPFFSTEREGSGLGLYLANELCRANRATLRLQENTPQGCRFRILFQYYDAP